jgi:hypothetical protein
LLSIRTPVLFQNQKQKRSPPFLWWSICIRSQC